MTKEELTALFEYIAANLLCSSDTSPFQINDFI